MSSLRKNEEKRRGELKKLKQSRGMKVLRILISDKAFSLMEKSLKDRGFIVERGFKKLISPFSEMLEKR